METANPSAESQLMRGTGASPGPHVNAFPFEERTLVHVLARQAAERPDTTWLVFDGRDSLTFREAQSLAYRFAAAATASVGEAPRVAIFLRNQIEFMPAFLGAQAAGGAAVPFNAELMGPLLEVMLEKSEATILVVREELFGHLEALDGIGQIQTIVWCGAGSPPTTKHGVRIVGFEQFIDAFDVAAPTQMPKATDIGALMFTSGTSGGSKAAVCTNHYLYWFPGCVADALELSPDDVLSTPLQVCHVAALHNFANSSLHAGCTVHLKSYFSAKNYWQEIAEDGATFSMLMGQMASMILRNVETAPPHKLRTSYILPQPVDREEYERRFGTNVVWHGWGMTEIFPHLPTRHRSDKAAADAIGPAPTWVDWGVVDEDDRLLPPNTMGELAYRPLIPWTMASGYYKDPLATEKAFRNLMFHTGDLGYYDEAGVMHFVMRNQDAIRRRGENISAVELERIALTHPSVVDVAAYAVPAELGEHEVKIDVVTDGQLELGTFHGWLSERLPRYMLPRYLEVRESLPKTISQRVEKYKLMKEPLDRPEVAVFEHSRRRAD